MFNCLFSFYWYFIMWHKHICNHLRAFYTVSSFKFFPVAQTVRDLPATQEIWVQPLGWEDPLEKGMAIHSNILAWRNPWTGEPGGLQSIGLQTVWHDWSNLACTWPVKNVVVVSGEQWRDSAICIHVSIFPHRTGLFKKIIFSLVNKIFKHVLVHMHTTVVQTKAS